LLFPNRDFLLVPEPDVYETVASLLHSNRIGPEREGQPRFQNNINIVLDNGTVIMRGEKLALLGIEEVGGVKGLRCKLLKRKANSMVWLPVTCRGLFQECHDDHYYTISQIVKWKIPAGRRRNVKPVVGTPTRSTGFSILPHNFTGQLQLLPYYSVKALIQFLPADLELQVMDVTDLVADQPFLVPVSLETLYHLPSNSFPVTVKVIDVKDNYGGLARGFEVGSCLTILGKKEMKKVLVTELSNSLVRQHFLVPRSYEGQLLRIPRTFQTVYDLELARMAGGVAWVVATTSYNRDAECLSSFGIGEQFRALHPATVFTRLGVGGQAEVKVLTCEKADSAETVNLPMYAEGKFIEILMDGERYTMEGLLAQHMAPFHVRVVTADLALTADPLPGLKELRVDGEVRMECLVARRQEGLAFEVPVELVTALVEVVNQVRTSPHQAQDPSPQFVQTVWLLSAEDYLRLRDYEDLSPPPPPRPPKPKSCSAAGVTGQLAKPLLTSEISMRRLAKNEAWGPQSMCWGNCWSLTS
uniref:CABIT domain-containing protein n=1 Tax=Callorhinchus milii TaxID=7868 RepID=A0A4W3J0H1_CALMI